MLLQDYHLYLTPAMVREAVPDATILHFTHIPWPGPRYWGLLPEFMRRRIHEDMCASDIVGLQTRADVQNFLHCCGVDPRRRRRRLSTPAPSAIAAAACTCASTRSRSIPPACSSSRTRRPCRSTSRGCRPARATRPIVRVDRSEPSKNIIRGLRACELLLERYPEFRARVNYLQFLVPSRSELGVYQTYTDEIFELVESINDHYGDVDWQPIRVFYEENYAQAIAGMTLYDVLLVNPIIDGMNLVSKEGPLVNERDGVLILSELAGSYEQLQECVLPVSPDRPRGDGPRRCTGR